MAMERCEWSDSSDLYRSYHDEEWGVPVYDDQDLFAKLILDGFQAGLSWITILKKRDGFYQAFDDFDPEKMAAYDEARHLKLMQNKAIIRNKLKIKAATTNAQAYLKLKANGQGFSDFLWSFVNQKPVLNTWTNMSQVPATSQESDNMSKALKKLGFKFVGSTICYAFMQAVGMVNDHKVSCPRHEACQKLVRKS